MSVPEVYSTLSTTPGCQELFAAGRLKYIMGCVAKNKRKENKHLSRFHLRLTKRCRHTHCNLITLNSTAGLPEGFMVAGLRVLVLVLVALLLVFFSSFFSTSNFSADSWNQVRAWRDVVTLESPLSKQHPPVSTFITFPLTMPRAPWFVFLGDACSSSFS